MKKITRREFFKIGAGITFASMLPRTILSAEQETATGPLVAVAHGEKSKLVKSAINTLGGIKKFINPGDYVLIKPNISFAANNENGATTSAAITKQVVELCFEAGAEKIKIIDFPLANSELCIAKSGIKKVLVNSKKISLLMLNKEQQFIGVSVSGGHELKRVKIARELLKADKFINLPIAKSHSATGVSLGIKNLMGLIWNRSYLHRVDLHRAIAELGLVIKPDLTIVDATKVLASGGPGGPGKTIVLNTVIAGVDMVAVDSYTVGLTRWYDRSFQGKDVKHILAASELGLGEIDIEKIVVKNVQVE